MPNISKLVPDAALDDRLGFVGTTGSGKTYNAGVCVERLLARGARIVIIDPLDVWYGLRVLPDGETPSPHDVVIFGGAHADLPINEHAGALIGETVAGMAESCIVSLGGFETAASERRFMLAFLTALYRHTTKEPLHLVFDEADMLAPQRVLDKEGDANKLLGRMEQIVRRGRVRGFIPWLITQRPAVVNKNVLSQMDGLVAFKLTSRQDRDALGSWVEGQADKGQWRETDAALATLPRGTGVVWLPGHGILETVAFPEKRTFDSSATPRRGETKRAAKLQPLNLEALKERLGTIEEEVLANDPTRLKKRIAELERQAKAAPAAGPSKADLAQARQEGFDAGQRQGFHDGLTSAYMAHFGKTIVAIKELIEAFETVPGLPEPPQTSPKTQAPPVTGLPKTRLQDAPQPQPARAKPNGSIGPERKPLASLAAMYPGGITEAQWATMAGFKRTGGTWAKYKSLLRTAGHIEQRDGLWFATASGVEVLGDTVPEMPTDPAGLLEFWAGNVKSAGKMLRVVAGNWPEPISRGRLAGTLGMTASGGTFAKYLSVLRSNELISVDGQAVRLRGENFGYPT